MTVDQLAQQLKPLGQYPKETRFGRHVWENANGNRQMAAYIALHLLTRGQEVFIADGSSGLWLMLAVLELDLAIMVKTNNAAVGIEKVLRHRSKATVFGAQGRYDPEYAGLFGRSAVRFCRRASAHAHLTVVPVTGLSFDEGPCAASPDARRVKRAAMMHARRPLSHKVVLMAGADKLGLLHPTPAVFSRAEWHGLRDSGNLLVVCDRPDGVPPGPPFHWDCEGVPSNLQAFCH